LDVLSRTAYCIIFSRKVHSTSSLRSSWSILLLSVKSSRWCKMKESTHSRLIKWEYFSSQ
jgi:hypothetical protein